MDPEDSPSIEVTVGTLDWGRMVTEPEVICQKAVKRCLDHLAGHAGAGWIVSILLTDDQTVQQLNRTHRSIDRPTNVLSFPYATVDEIAHSVGPLMLGDIVLAAQTVEREARAQRKTPTDHLSHLLVHGTLHLLGHDHEQETAAEMMEQLERTILQSLGISDPYLEADPYLAADPYLKESIR